MGHDQTVERVASPGFREGGRDHAVERARGHPHVERVLQRAHGISGRCVDAPNLVEELQLQHDRW